jgi:hypothetical protein
VHRELSPDIHAGTAAVFGLHEGDLRGIGPGQRGGRMFAFHRPQNPGPLDAEADDAPGGFARRARFQELPPLDICGPRAARARAITSLQEFSRQDEERGLILMAARGRQDLHGSH